MLLLGVTLAVGFYEGRRLVHNTAKALTAASRITASADRKIRREEADAEPAPAPAEQPQAARDAPARAKAKRKERGKGRKGRRRARDRAPAVPEGLRPPTTLQPRMGTPFGRVSGIDLDDRPQMPSVGPPLAVPAPRDDDAVDTGFLDEE